MNILHDNPEKHLTKTKSNYPSITVIVPVHGTEQYIEKCLSSILSQDFSDFEVIVVDDASPDNAMVIVEKMAAEDHRIKIIRHPVCRGQGAARNSGITAARGQFLAFVDSDDFVAPSFLSKPLKVAIENNLDIIEFGLTRVDSSGTKKLKTYLPMAPANSLNFLDYKPSVCIKLWRRDFLDNQELLMPEGIRFEDLQFTTQAIAAAKKIDTLSVSLYMYRMRENSTIKSYKNSDFRDYLIALSNVREFLINRAQLTHHKKNYDLLVWNHMGHASSRARRGGSRLTAIYIKIIRLAYWLSSRQKNPILTTAAVLRWQKH